MNAARHNPARRNERTLKKRWIDFRYDAARKNGKELKKKEEEESRIFRLAFRFDQLEMVGSAGERESLFESKRI